jgi:putative hydrolase of the HAD superfamily
MLRAIVFDFGNVVGFFSHRKAAQQLAAYTTAKAEEIQAFLFADHLEDDYESGRLSTVEYRRIVRDQFPLTCSDEQFDQAVSDMFAPNREVCALIPSFKERFKLLLLSNTNDLHYRHFSRQFANTLGHFDEQVLSHRVGMRKPDPKIYEHCLHLAGVDASQCLFIDDLQANIEGAKKCGWQGILYRPGHSLKHLLA